MKKALSLLLFICLFTFQSKTQTLFYESFESPLFPPSGWQNVQIAGTGLWDRVPYGFFFEVYPHTGSAMARFDCYSFPTGTIANLNTPSFDLSSFSGNAKVRFWMYRDQNMPSFQDSVEVYINTSTSLSGATKLGCVWRLTNSPPVETTSGWYEYTFNIPGSFTGVTNFILLAGYSGWGNDFFIDDFSVFVPVADDAGISSIPSPSAPLLIGVSPFTVQLSNFGTNSLSYTTINWSVNGLLQAPFIWSGILSPGSTSPPIMLGTYNFATPAIYKLKAWTNNPNGTPDINPVNDSTIKFVFPQLYASIPFSENFDGNWINKNDTLDVPNPYWVNSPSFGYNSWRRDDQGLSGNWLLYTWNHGAYTPAGANSTNHSARFHSYNAISGMSGKIDLYVDFSQSGNKKLRFWYINPDGTDSLFVLLSTDNGVTFSYKYGIGNDKYWNERTVLLGGSINTQCVLRFQAKSDHGYTDIGLDEIRLTIQPPNDITAFNITEPNKGHCNMSASENFSIKVTNIGVSTATNIPVAYSINNGISWINEFIPGNILPNDTVEYTFLTPADFSVPGQFSCIGKTIMSGDMDTTNDKTQRFITSNTEINSFPFCENFETGYSPFFVLKDTMESDISISSNSGTGGSWGLQMTGGSFLDWPTTGGETSLNVWNEYFSHHASAATCNIDATSLTSLMLKFDLVQTYSNNISYSWFRVLVNGIQIADTAGISNFKPLGYYQSPTHYFDLTSYAGTNFIIELQSSCKYKFFYDQSDASYLDNIYLFSVESNDVGVSVVKKPINKMCGVASDSVIVSISNFGSSTQTNIPVTALINTPSGIQTLSGILPGPLLPSETDDLNLGIVNSLAGGTYSIKSYTSLVGDIMNHFNDTANYSFSIATELPTPHTENFESTTPLENWYTTNMHVSPTGNHGNTSAILSANVNTSLTYLSRMSKKVGFVQNGDYLQFDYRIVNNDSGNTATILNPSDLLRVQVSTDCEIHYIPFYSINQSNHIPSTSLKQVLLPLTSYVGNSIIPRFLITYGGSGNYFVDIDNVRIGPRISLNLGNDTAICYPNTIVLDADSGVGFTYEWHEASTPGIIGTNQTFSVSQSGLYYLLLTDSIGQMFTDSINITIVNPNSIFISNDTTLCANNTLELNAGAGFTSYLWSTGANTQMISVDTTGIGLATVTYSVSASLAGQCSGIDTISVHWITCPGIAQNHVSWDVQLYPNPTNGEFTLSTGVSIGHAEVTLYDKYGRMLEHWNTNGKIKNLINIGHLASGVYTLYVRNSRVTKILKVVKE
ncbi:MAG: T9SS type A sorting domain-containing protein [Bacteroidota bacterium]